MSKLDELLQDDVTSQTSDRLHSVFKKSLFTNIFIRNGGWAVAMQRKGKTGERANAE